MQDDKNIRIIINKTPSYTRMSTRSPSPTPEMTPQITQSYINKSHNTFPITPNISYGAMRNVYMMLIHLQFVIYVRNLKNVNIHFYLLYYLIYYLFINKYYIFYSLIPY